jgi:RecA-family ATPase
MDQKRRGAMNGNLPARTLAYLQNGAQKGNRNEELMAAACQLRDADYSEAEAIEKLIIRATADGLSSKEALSTINSAFSRAPREPSGPATNRRPQCPYHKREVAPLPLPKPMEQSAIRFLESVFRPGEFVGISDAIETRDGDGKIRVAPNCGLVRTRDTWIADIRQRGLEAIFKSTDGLFVRANPFRDATGKSDEDVSVYRHVVIESDEGPKEEQLGALHSVGLPISVITDSGNRSLHALVVVDAPDEVIYRDRFETLREYCTHALGLKVDRKNKNPSRFSRMPGARRARRDPDTDERIIKNGQPILDHQTLLECNRPGMPWDEWAARTLAKDDDGLEPYKPKGNSPTGYFEKNITNHDILLGNGFLERESAALLAGPSGIGKSSIAMQMGCSWSCAKPAFDFVPPRELRIVMVQHEDSQNDLSRQSAIVISDGLDKEIIRKNFWIETVRGQIGTSAIKIMRDLVIWWHADLLILNPLTAYHDGDISQNRDNVKFLYGELGRLLSDLRIALFAFHHKGKPPRENKNNREDVYHEIMYEVLGGSVLTNFFRGIITVSPIPNSAVYKFTVAKRFEESGWPLTTQQYKWHDDRSKRLWVPASVAETEKARKGAAKTIEDLYKLAPVTGAVPKDAFEMTAMKAGFTRGEYRGILAQALDDSTPDDVRLFQWSVYNPAGPAKAAISRFSQPENETHQAVRAAKSPARRRPTP